MRRNRIHREPDHQEGVIIALVAVFLLFVVGAMAAISIDITTFYTARSEAQLAADGAALAAARVLANSGMTSDPSLGLVPNAETVASAVAQQVATTNQVGGVPITASQVTVTFNDTSSPNNPHVTVQVRTALPAFFARIWGTTQVNLTVSATAEAYNPSGLASGVGSAVPVATACVKPWVLPNMDPRNGNPIFDPASGAIESLPTSLLGWSDPMIPLYARCGGSCNGTQTPIAWQYFPGDPASFPTPTQALPDCGFSLNAYQESVAGCVQTPIACGSTVQLDATSHPGRNSQTGEAVNCLTHSTPYAPGSGDSISVNPALMPGEVFQFWGGANNPVSGAVGNNVIVSDSLVTVPVYNSTAGAPGSGPVTVIGFLQLFLNPDGSGVPFGPPPGHINTAIVNLVGCGTNTSGITPVYGNGPSAVPVRLITPP